MKLNKFAQLSVLAMVVAFAAAGCSKNPSNLTKLPGYGPGKVPVDEDPNRLAQEGKPISTEINWDPANFIEDRAALAPQTVHFDFDSYAVKSGEKSKVRAVVAALKADATAKLMIEGHCDERGTEEYNRSLGERRALALRESLAAMGIDPMRIRTISWGEDKPVDPGHDESAWKKNRRGEFVLMLPKK